MLLYMLSCMIGRNWLICFKHRDLLVENNISITFLFSTCGFLGFVIWERERERERENEEMNQLYYTRGEDSMPIYIQLSPHQFYRSYNRETDRHTHSHSGDRERCSPVCTLEPPVIKTHTYAHTSTLSTDKPQTMLPFPVSSHIGNTSYS